MDTVRIGIIGMGNMGRHHADYLRKGAVKQAVLKAVCSPSPHKLESYKPLAIYGDGESLIQSGEVDAVIIATPHYQHTTLGIKALDAGLHLMVEKPISAHKADAQRLISKSRQHPSAVFAAMFQLRAEPRYAKIRRLIADGELGEVVRVNWIITDWYRTDAYYASSAWRATWKGEGGGVLLNQCLHQLDALQWMCGMPVKVRSFVQLGRFHNVEVEDSVTAYLEYPNGASGVFVSSTGEAPGSNRLEIAGTRGKIVLENNQLAFTRNQTCMLEFSRTAKTGFAKPEVWNIHIPFADANAPHAMLMQNFVNAILHKEPLLAPGEDGLPSVELANAMLYSGLLNQTVPLPLDAAAFETKLNQLIANSKFKKQTAEVSADNFAQSFNR